MKTKMSRSDLEARCDALNHESSVLRCALNDVLKGDVKWFGRSPYRLGVCRPTSACGGIALVQSSGMTNAYYFERYCQTELSHIACILTGEDNELNAELLMRRSLIESAKQFVRESHQTAA